MLRSRSQREVHTTTGKHAAMVRGTFKGVNKVRRRLASGRYSVHYYHRATGRKLPGSPGTAEFARAWAEAEQAAQNPACRVLADLSQRFQNSTDFTHGLKPSTQSEYARMLGAIEVEFGDTPVAVIQDRRFKGDLLEWRDRLSKAGKLREAENRLTIAARLFAWGVGRGYIETNPLTTWERA